MMTDLYLTTSIPYVNGSPHLGHALELVHADVLARHRRLRGRRVRLQTGTDDHALKNVTAADAAGEPVGRFVARNVGRFRTLVDALGVEADEFVSTSADERHPFAVRELWERCARAGDLFQGTYDGLYCAGCEQFFESSELVDGIVCPEHGTPAERVSERNWFFRLSRYREQILGLIESGALQVEPEVRRNELIGFLREPVRDLSVSRPADRAAGWGIPVPGDPEQVVYVWFDALTNYLTGLGFGTPDESQFDRWWAGGVERTHVVGKGIARFHAVFWIAFLLSAGIRPPSRVLVHDYLTVDGQKIAKSGPPTADPVELVDALGVDALRWWLIREPSRVGTSDYSEAAVRRAHDRDLAKGLGNLVARITALLRRTDRLELLSRAPDDSGARLATAVDEAVHAYDLRRAALEITGAIDRGNRVFDTGAPWKLVPGVLDGDPRAAAEFDDAIVPAIAICREVASELSAFIPRGSERIRLALTTGEDVQTFPRLVPPADR